MKYKFDVTIEYTLVNGDRALAEDLLECIIEFAEKLGAQVGGGFVEIKDEDEAPTVVEEGDDEEDA